ncbi:MAG: DNA recombination protein RmuC, partial [Gammaproteobacteria bacterium]
MTIGEALLLAAAVALLAGALWMVRTLVRGRAAEREWVTDELDRLQDGFRHALDGTRQDIVATLARSQVLGQESHQRGLAALKEGIDDRLGRLQRQTLEDGGALRTDLVGRFEQFKRTVGDELANGRLSQQRELGELRQALDAALARHRAMDQRQADNIRAQQDALAGAMQAMSRQVVGAFQQSAAELGKRVEDLTRTTDGRLKEIAGQVEQRLSEGFQKTTETFTRVLEHLSRIDEAQKKITELSSNVVSLQEVLTDKRSRGAFGEVQLEGLVANLLPEGSYRMQATLSNDTRVDCLLFLPEPTGQVPVDAKFPLESFQRMTDFDLAEGDRARAARQFRVDIKRHVGAIAEKYIIPGETAQGAVMFLPAEAIFAEIHARFPDLVEEAHSRRVWLVSPTTLMAVLTTARAVLKDDATRRQVHVIQDHLRQLAQDFARFQGRMDNLARHIAQAHQDVEQVNTSARKITER